MSDWTETVASMTKEELEKALVMTIGALSTTSAFADKTPDQVFDWLFDLMNYQRRQQNGNREMPDVQD